LRILPIKKNVIQMKGSFIIVFLLVELIALLNAFAVQAQQGRSQIPVVKNNFTSFTRKYKNRGKLWIARNKDYLRHPDANFGDNYSPDNRAVELFAKRTIDSKFYINKDTPSICYTQKSSGPVHFKKNGQWVTIDTRLNPKGPLLYEASNQEQPVGFDIKRKSSYIVTSDGKTYFNNWKLYGKNLSTETLLATADWTHYTTGDDGIAIKNIFPGIDAEMKVSRGSVKTSFIVHANRFSTYKTLLFRDAFLNGHSGNFTFSNGLHGNGLVSAADFRVSTSTVFHIQEGVMYQENNPSSSHQFIPYYLENNKLTLAINSNFLNDQFKMGDIIIDPLVQSIGMLKRGMITGSHSNQDCSLDTACEYDFMVPTPPGATIVNAMFSFEFTAHAPCVAQDGAFSFAINGGCLSQMYAGTGTGPQRFQNQTILLKNGNGVAGCFPSPVCGPGPRNIPFSFYFYRKCHGPEGCDGSCIAASKDLTITLVGRTFDSASVTATPQNSCAGSMVTLTARGYYGIPPYNFTWQGLPQYNGDSVIQVNPLANTTYNVQISEPCPGAGGPIMKSINVKVLPKPPAPGLTSNSPVCTGGQLILAVPPAPGTTYFISNPGSGLGSGQYSSIAVFNNVTAAYAGTWIAIATDANGCTSDTASTIVVVNPALSPTVTITASATNICAGSTVSFTATASNAGNSPTYQWLVNSKKAGTNSPVFSSNSFANNDAVSCIVSASGPCAGASDISNTIVINVDATGTPTFDAIGPLCQNSTATALPPTSKEGIAGTWSPASINTSVIGTATYTFSPSSSGNCATPTSLDITIVNSITPTFPTIADSYCQNATAPALPTSSKEGVNGTWSPSSINTTTVGSTSYTFTPTTGQCGTSSQISVAINPLPTLIMGPDVTIAPGASTTLNVSVTGNIISYQWIPPTGLNNASIEDPVASPSATTVYTLDVTDANQCEASDSIKINVSGGGGGSSKILVPNAFSPNGDGINDTWVITNLSAYPGATVDVFNRYGQLVFHSENYNKAWDGTFNGKSLPAATYYYIIDPKNNEKKQAGSVTLFK
jgi:gliding motility-associated-like protein